MHSLTTEAGRVDLLENTRNTLATLLACGIDPERSILYNQSRVSGHAELCWILTTLTPMSELRAMTQFKDKSAGSSITLTGLFTYPVLMAADILLYRATHVPVGDDQVQHLELARTLADKFNRVFCVERGYDPLFPIPNVLHTESRRVMSLKDANKKMSKSDPASSSRIDLSDSPAEVSKKLRKAKTDSISGIQYDHTNRPELANLIDLYSAFSNLSPQEIEIKHQAHDMFIFKQALIDAVNATVGPISSKIELLKNDKTFLDHVADKGAKSANEQALATMRLVRPLIGYL
jgi:tryptophanyl-tRNA synthetase